MRAKQYLIGLFWYESELPLLYVINKCSERFGSLTEGLYVVADAINDGVLAVTANGALVIA